ncbi:MAG: thiamine phosphate synthase, partial [Bdellovibrionota bacterium]
MPLPDVPILYLIASRGHGEKLPAVAKAVRQIAPPSKLTLLVQLRDKEATARQVYETAAAWAQTLKPLEVPLLLNERVDIALASGVAGAHLSKESFSIADARSLLPK